MIKKNILTVITLLMLLSLGTYCCAAAHKQVSVDINGAQIEAGYIIDDTVYLPIRAVCVTLGYTITWSQSGDNKLITATKDGKKIIIDINNQKTTVNDHVINMYGNFSGDGCIIYNNHAYLEAGILSESFGLSEKYDKQNAKVTLNRIIENSISITTMKVNSDNDDITIDLQYPQIDGLKDSDVQDNINTVFREAAVKAEDEGLQSAYELKKAKEEIPEITNKCGTYFDYRIKYNQNGFLSIVLLNSQYTGGAHEGTIQTSYTFDLNTGKVLGLNDLMKSGTDYVSIINSAVRSEIDERVKSEDLYEFEDSKFKSIGSTPDYYLSDNAVVFYFQEYEYFPYAAGIQEFPVEYSKLKDMLKSDYSFLSNDTYLLEAGTANVLTVGEIGKVSLKGNPTTGYSWNYKIENSDIIAPETESFVSDSNLIGSGGTYVWNFKALKKGQTKITFKYYRSWEGEASVTAENTVEYLVTVK